MVFIELCLEAAEILKGCQDSQEEKKMKNNLNNPSQSWGKKKVSRAAAIFFLPRMVCLSPSLVIVIILCQIIWGLQRRKGVRLQCLGSGMMWGVAPCKLYNLHSCFLHADFLSFSDVTDWQVRSLFMALFSGGGSQHLGPLSQFNLLSSMDHLSRASSTG